VEAGPHTRDEPNHVQPARFYRCLMRPTETFTFHVSKPTPALRDRVVVVPTGRALGGGSSVNCMKIIIMVDAQTDIVITGIKFFITHGQRPRITTIGKTYMGIKDGVLSI
jgi:GMC oxidoreductase